MKKILLLLSGLVLIALPNCGRCCKKSCTKETVCQDQCTEKRVSGPLSEKEVGWDQEDYS